MPASERATARRQTAIVVGGGIGGLAAAASLLQSGWRVMVVERASSFGEIGAGFAVSRNGLASLADVGVDKDALASAYRLSMDGTMDARGRWLIRLPREGRGDAHRLMYGIHRQALHRILLAAAADAELRISAAVTAVHPGTAGGAAARVEIAGQGGPEVAHADLVVGADGLRSATRAAINVDAHPNYSGMSSWRGIVDDDSHAEDGFAMMWGPGAEFGAVRVSPTQIYWYGYIRLPEGTVFVDEPGAALSAFRGWVDPAVSLIDRTPPDRLLRHDVYTLSPRLRSYVRGRLVLIGDAAHPMLPTMGQGANSALEDAVSVGRLIARPTVGGEPLAVGLDRYNRERYRRTQTIVRRSALTARFGSHLASPIGVPLRNALLRMLPAERIAAAGADILDWTPARAE